MPEITSIRTSVENKDIFVLDSHAKNGTFERDARGRLKAYSGGFSVVYPYKTTNDEKWAFRCWHADIKNAKERYEAISEAIKKAKLGFFCEFQYIDKGITVDGKVYPTTRMRWIDGSTIKDYICRNKHSKGLLIALAEEFLKMTRELHSRKLAHGDLQHGNILVDDKNQIHLVDYDSFYCPSLKGEIDEITGLPDYQHPARKRNRTVSEKLDYFSELIIYISILAIAENPDLAIKYKVDDADRLLFSKEDFEDLKDSQVYNDIHSLGGKFVNLLKILENYLSHGDINDLEPFELQLIASEIQFASSTSKAKRNSEEIKIFWNVPIETNYVSIIRLGDGKPQKCENSGTIKTTLSEKSTYELKVVTSSGYEIRKQVYVEVFDECVINFKADKYYIFPGVPVLLTWEVKNAKAVWLNNEKVNSSGWSKVEPMHASTYKIVAEDEFGKKQKEVSIQMLPIPQIKSLQVPTPNINSTMSLTIKQPRFNVGLKFPHFNVGFVKVTTRRVPSLTDLGINVELVKDETELNYKRVIKKLYNIINHKVKQCVQRIKKENKQAQ